MSSFRAEKENRDHDAFVRTGEIRNIEQFIFYSTNVFETSNM